MPRKGPRGNPTAHDERKLKAEIFELLSRQDATTLSRLFTHALHALAEQIEKLETGAVRAAHFGRREEQARLERWLAEYKDQLTLVEKLQLLVILHGGLAAARDYFRPAS